MTSRPIPWRSIGWAGRHHDFPEYRDELGQVGPLPVTDGQRRAPESVIDPAIGEILLVGDEPTGVGGDTAIRLSATYHGGGDELESGIGRQSFARFELAPGLHIYNEPVPERARSPRGSRWPASKDCIARRSEIPQAETLSIRVPVAKYLGHELPGSMPGALITSMDTRKYMIRKVRRGLLRSPIKGLRYLKQGLAQLRRGPARGR